MLGTLSPVRFATRMSHQLRPGALRAKQIFWSLQRLVCENCARRNVCTRSSCGRYCRISEGVWGWGAGFFPCVCHVFFRFYMFFSCFPRVGEGRMTMKGDWNSNIIMILGTELDPYECIVASPSSSHQLGPLNNQSFDFVSSHYTLILSIGTAQTKHFELLNRGLRRPDDRSVNWNVDLCCECATGLLHLSFFQERIRKMLRHQERVPWQEIFEMGTRKLSKRGVMVNKPRQDIQESNVERHQQKKVFLCVFLQYLQFSTLAFLIDHVMSPVCRLDRPCHVTSLQTSSIFNLQNTLESREAEGSQQSAARRAPCDQVQGLLSHEDDLFTMHMDPSLMEGDFVGWEDFGPLGST